MCCRTAGHLWSSQSRGACTAVGCWRANNILMCRRLSLLLRLLLRTLTGLLTRLQARVGPAGAAGRRGRGRAPGAPAPAVQLQPPRLAARRRLRLDGARATNKELTIYFMVDSSFSWSICCAKGRDSRGAGTLHMHVGGCICRLYSQRGHIVAGSLQGQQQRSISVLQLCAHVPGPKHEA